MIISFKKSPAEELGALLQLKYRHYKEYRFRRLPECVRR